MIMLLGASGYMGQAFARELRRRERRFIPLTRKAIDYTQFGLLFDYVRKMKPEFVINAAGFVGRPNVDACEQARDETLRANAILPQTVSRACLMTNTPWAHVSSGGIYSGAKVAGADGLRIENDLSQPALRSLFTKKPELFRGFTEWDEPNFSFRRPPCNFYCGTKALAEEEVRSVGQVYLWRPGIPFSEQDEPRNFLSKLQRCSKIYDAVNSLSHLDDFVRACLELWERRAPFGIYNVTNPGAVTTRQVVEAIERILKPDHRFEFWKEDEEFFHFGVEAPRSHCILDTSKLLAAGVSLRPVREALTDALRNWRAASIAWSAVSPRGGPRSRSPAHR